MMKVRKGFTLVELLIVIVIIGILAAAMMLSSGGATDSAEASNIISNLRGMKAAAMMLYMDSMDDFAALHTMMHTTNQLALLAQYMDNPGLFVSGSHYMFRAGTGAVTSHWFVGFDLGAAQTTSGVRRRLASRARSIGLLANRTSLTDIYIQAGTEVWQAAR